MWSLLEYNEKEPIILSVNENDEISIEEIAKKIAREFNYEDQLVFDTSYSDGQYKKTADNSKLTKLYPNFEFTNVNIGIQNSVQWFKDNFSVLRK
jgi:GDP-L-fucose synthase